MNMKKISKIKKIYFIYKINNYHLLILYSLIINIKINIYEI